MLVQDRRQDMHFNGVAQRVCRSSYAIDNMLCVTAAGKTLLEYLPTDIG